MIGTTIALIHVLEGLEITNIPLPNFHGDHNHIHSNSIRAKKYIFAKSDQKKVFNISEKKIDFAFAFWFDGLIGFLGFIGFVGFMGFIGLWALLLFFMVLWVLGVLQV